MEPSNVWLPSGLFPTCLASGNSGLVLTVMLRALCPLYSIFTEWFELTHGKKRQEEENDIKMIILPTSTASTDSSKGWLRTRRPMPIETLLSKGFPEDTPVVSDEVGFRFAGNAVPCNWFTGLFTLVCSHLEEAGVSKRLVPNESQYSTV